MPTKAEYLVLNGKERIVSVTNDNGAGVAVPEMDLVGYGFHPYKPGKGNRKITLAFVILTEGGAILSEDKNIILCVKTPSGIIRDRIQRFKYSSSPPYATNSLIFSPIPKVTPISRAAIIENVYGEISLEPGPDEQNQTTCIRVVNDGAGSNSIIFYLELDWSHSLEN